MINKLRSADDADYTRFTIGVQSVGDDDNDGREFTEADSNPDRRGAIGSGVEGEQDGRGNF